MIKKLIIIFLLISNISSAQNKLQPTQFDSFITQSNIEWAAYVNQYLNFEKCNLNKLLFNRFLKNEIKVSVPISNGSYHANHINYIGKDSLDKISLEPMSGDPIYDSNGNLPDMSKIKPYEIDTTILTSTAITQILYIENGVLKSYVPWISPSIVKETTAQTNIFIGYSEYFSSCYNYNFNYQPNKINEILYMGETNRKLKSDSMGYGYSPIKELYRKNLLEALLPNFWTNKFDIFTVDTKIKLNPKEISDSAIFELNKVPENGNYDSISLYKFPENYFNLEDIKEFELVQDWYYDSHENIVFNKIKELYLWAKKWTINGEDKKSSPILKIVFK
ncbi:MAG: hypothetical protein ABI685_01010 [Ferruginibacter sp.]